MLWTLILSMTIWTPSGVSTHSVTVPNISTKEACQATGQEHVNKYRNPLSFTTRSTVSAVYTCVEQGKF